MSDAVRARGLAKSYKLYSSYAQRALDALGLLTQGQRDRIPEHVALHGVDLQIRRGEKVAIIGRNGAGKSTLLKLVTGVVQPTAGSIEVSGSVKALLEIGAGFHPELTGRQNVLGYLGHLGVTAAAAERALAEIVEFAEVEEYLGQPMKTYSAGMAMRLMFSAATQIAPDILVLDEVLSVGDAYFNQKSFGRIRDLCAAKDATLLLVTHDIYAARTFCDRFVWIDAGAIRADGDPVDVVQRYEESVRAQARTERTRRLVAAAERAEPGSLVIEIGPPRNEHWPAPAWFRRIALYEGERLLGELLADGGSSGSAWLDAEGCWSGPDTKDGSPARRLAAWSAPFQRAAVRIVCAGGPSDPSRLAAVIEGWSSRECALEVGLRGAHVPPRVAVLPLPSAGWTRLEIREFLPVPPRDADGRYRYGTGRAVIEAVAFLDDAGQPSEDFQVGGAMIVDIAVRVLDPELNESSTLLVAFHKEGIVEATRVVTEELRFESPLRAQQVRLTLEPLLLSDGDYLVSVMLAQERYFWRPTVYFTISPNIHDFWARSFRVRVRGAHPAERGGVFRHPARWVTKPADPKGAV